MIPPEELARLRACVRDAWDLAEQGRVVAGYKILDLGLLWAETPALNPFTGEQSPPDPWSAELIGCYRHELARYILQNRESLGSYCLVRQAQYLREAARELRVTARSLCEDATRLRRRCGQLPQRERSMGVEDSFP